MRNTRHFGLDDAFYSNSFGHHGILGQKWGIRRFQNPDGSLTPAGRERYYGSDGKLTDAGKKAFQKKDGRDTYAGKKYKQWQEANRPLTPEEKEARKQEAMLSGDVNKVYAARKEMSNQELQTALNRIDLERKISSLANAQEVDRGEIAISKALKGLDTSTKVLTSAINLWDKYDSIQKRLKTQVDREKNKEIEEAIKNGDIGYAKDHPEDFTANQLTELMSKITKTDELNKYEDSRREKEESDAKAKREKEDREAANKAARTGDFEWILNNSDKMRKEDYTTLKESIANGKEVIKMNNLLNNPTSKASMGYEAGRKGDWATLLKYWDSLPDSEKSYFTNSTNMASKINQYMKTGYIPPDDKKDDDFFPFLYPDTK